MPIAPNFHIEHIHNLALQLKRAPDEVKFLQIGNAEELIEEIIGHQLYPLDYVVYRITGYRGESVNEPMLLGSALVGDLVALIAIVSRTLDITAEGMMTVEEASNRLGVSQRTTSRLRREGFVFRWVVEPSGRRRLGCSEKTLNSFRERNKERMKTASNFSRLTQAEQNTIVEQAMQYKGSGRSLNDVASELAESTDRGHETIRALLQSVKQTNQSLSKPPPLSRQKARVIERAIRFGVPWEVLTERYQRSAGALRKVVERLRATRLSQMEICHVELDVFQRDEAEDVILGTFIAQHPNPPVLEIDPLDLVNMDYGRTNTDEIAIVSAMHLLRRRARVESKRLGYSPTEAVLDRIETDLRWAYLLQQELMVMSFNASISVAVQHVGRPLHELPSNKIVSLVGRVIGVVGNVCGSLDPSKGQTAASTPASVLDRSLSAGDMSHATARAAARHKISMMRCPFHDVVPWSNLIPRINRSTMANESSGDLFELVSLRFGWNGRPRTIVEIASEMNRSTNWISRQLRSRKIILSV